MRVPAGRVSTTDSFYNFALRLGLPTDNALAQSDYQPNFLSRLRYRLESMYRGSWLVGVAVDVMAKDMTRAGVEYLGDMSPEDIAALGSAERRLRIWKRLQETVKWARLYGGAIAYMDIDGQKPDEPLRVETIGRKQFRGLRVYDRWQVQPSVGTLVQEPGPDFGTPVFYQPLTADDIGVGERLHHSRCLRILGQELPYQQRIAENYWGQSVIERVYDRIVAFDSVTMGAAQLAYKAYLRTLKIENLRQLIATGGKAYDAVVSQIDLIRKYQSAEGLTLLDAADEFQTNTYAFAGLSDLLVQYGQQFSGAVGVPLVRLFGQSPAGLNSTGDSDWENYYNNVLAEQEDHLTDPLMKLFPVLAMSELGRPLPEDFDFRFSSLWQMQETERATVAETLTRAVVGAMESGLVTHETALKELKQAAERIGVWTNISDEEIVAAHDDPPPLKSEMPDLGNLFLRA